MHLQSQIGLVEHNPKPIPNVNIWLWQCQTHNHKLNPAKAGYIWKLYLDSNSL